MQQHFFSFESGELQKNKKDSSSHCSSVQERLVTYGSEALDTAEHLGLILGSQKAADALLDHFGSLAVLARASVEELLPFVPRSRALRLVSSLRMGAVALREERQSLTIDGPEAIADLCSEMRFLDREWLRVVLLNVKQQLIKVATVSQGSINESLAHPREVFKPGLFSPPTPSSWCIIIPPVLYRIQFYAAWLPVFLRADNVPMQHKTAGFVRVFSGRPAGGRLDGIGQACSAPGSVC